MVNFMWLFVAFFVGACIGMIIMAVCSATRANEDFELLQEMGKRNRELKERLTAYEDISKWCE